MATAEAAVSGESSSSEGRIHYGVNDKDNTLNDASDTSFERETKAKAKVKKRGLSKNYIEISSFKTSGEAIEFINNFETARWTRTRTRN